MLFMPEDKGTLTDQEAVPLTVPQETPLFIQVTDATPTLSEAVPERVMDEEVVV